MPPMVDPVRSLRGWIAAVMIAAILVALSLSAGGLATQALAAEPTKSTTRNEATVVTQPAELKVANRSIVTLRTGFFGATPADRVAGIEERIRLLIGRGGPLKISTRPIEGGYAIFMDENLVFRVLDTDVDPEVGGSAEEVAERAGQNLRQALSEISEVRDTRTIVYAVITALAATVVLLGVLWALIRAYRWAARRLTSLAEARAEKLARTLGHQVAGQIGLARIVITPLRIVAILIGALSIYEWLGVVLKQFPYTRPWGEALLSNLLDALGEFVLTAAKAVPGLLFVLLIFLVARFVVRILHAFFASVEQGRLNVAWVDETTARPTGKLVSAIVWLLALVAAYPYIPGSGSQAFKGIGVFVGLMLSIGSSGVVNQAVSGLMLLYTRSFKPGEFVKVGDTEGIVRSIGFLTTQIETLRREHITIPNAVIVGNVMRNYSRFKGQDGAKVATTITIGYDVPWRQVQAMLRLAAERTEGLLKDPPVRILQTALLDHAVEYTILATISEPTTRPLVLDALHSRIQDVFNEYGVQIMSPRYEKDPEQPKVVPRDQWFRAPASPAANAGDQGA
jgi:small-conductance mechanosensitive channel